MKYTITACFECSRVRDTEELYEYYAREVDECIQIDKVAETIGYGDEGRIKMAVVASFEFSDQSQATKYFDELRRLEQSQSIQKIDARLYADKQSVDSFGNTSPFVKLIGTGWTSSEILTVA